ncbi:hypothetical protein A1D31_38600 [Bradyrhizobium liaoningense]|nr:hypothetical protein A1D31_38600 [Bradyrhizobium liaoningense]
MDIAVLLQVKPGKAELVFCEAKCADNPELWGLEKLPKEAKSLRPPERLTAVIARVRKYEHDIQAKETQESLIEGYVGVSATAEGEDRVSVLVAVKGDGFGRCVFACFRR